MTMLFTRYAKQTDRILGESLPSTRLLSKPNRVADDALLGVVVGDLSGHVRAAGLAHALVGAMDCVNVEETN